jgi:hypothetical protein
MMYESQHFDGRPYGSRHLNTAPTWSDKFRYLLYNIQEKEVWCHFSGRYIQWSDSLCGLENLHLGMQQSAFNLNVSGVTVMKVQDNHK